MREKKNQSKKSKIKINYFLNVLENNYIGYIYNGFVASQYNKTILSKSTFSPSDHQLEYKDGETIRSEIPPFQSFMILDKVINLKLGYDSPEGYI